MGGEDWKEAASRAMDRYAEGDEDALGVVYDRLSRPLYAFFVRRTRSRDDAEDLLQKTFMRIVCARRHFVDGGDVVPWAYCIARNVWIDFHRQSRRKAWVVSADTEEQHGEACGPSSHELLEDKQLGARVAQELAKLRDAYREAFVLLQLDGLSVRDAAAVVGCTETAMKLRAHRSYEALRSALGDEAVHRFGGRR